MNKYDPHNLIPGGRVWKFLLGDNWFWRSVTPHVNKYMIASGVFAVAMGVWMATDHHWLGMAIEFILAALLLSAMIVTGRRRAERERYFAEVRAALDRES